MSLVTPHRPHVQPGDFVHSRSPGLRWLSLNRALGIQGLSDKGSFWCVWV